MTDKWITVYRAAIIAAIVFLALKIDQQAKFIIIKKASFHTHNSICKTPKRIGNKRDGGWWICNQKINKNCIVYSFGIRNDWSFDQHMADEFNCIVHGFDPDYKIDPAKYNTNHKLHLHTWGIGYNDNKIYQKGQTPFLWPGIDYLKMTNTYQWTLKSLQESMKSLDNIHIDVLKLDVEGHEWFALDKMLQNDSITSGVAQIAAELHFDPEAFTINTHKLGFSVNQIKAYSVNIIDILTRLNNKFHIWKWKWNENNYACIEIAAILK